MGEKEKKRLRKLKPTLAKPDDPIYQVGFVVGGKRLSKNTPAKQNPKP